MENLIIEETKFSPSIVFDGEKHSLSITGKSYPENTSVFYAPVFSWLEDYIAKLDDNQEVGVNIELIYFNSSSSKVLLDFFDILDEAAEDGKSIAVNWIYEEDDEDSLEFGEEFKEDYESLTFNLVEKKPE